MTADIRSAYLTYGPELSRFLRRRSSDGQAAPDLVHDAFLRMAEHADTQVTDVRAYLFRIARNLLLDERKQQARRRTTAVAHETMAHIADDGPSPEAAVCARLRLDRLREAIGQLPFKTQQIFVLNRIDGLTYPEVARRLGVSESSVQKHLATALRHVARSVPGI